MKIGILQADHLAEELQQDYGDVQNLYFAMLMPVMPGATFEVYAVVDDIFPETPDQCDGWIITGSKFGAYDPEAWIGTLEEFIRQIANADKPLVGICFGHQIIAQAMGGRVEKSEKGWGCGIYTYDLSNDFKFDHLPPQKIDMNAFHQDQVLAVPEGAKILAQSEFCEHAMLEYEGGNILSFQGHPEFSNSFTKNLVDVREARIGEENAQRARDSLSTQAHNDEIAQFIADFFKSRIA